MAGVSEKSRVLSAKAMENAEIPPFDKLKAKDPEQFRLTLGDLDVTLISQEYYVAKSQGLWEAADASVTVAGSSCTAKQYRIPISGEVDLTDKMLRTQMDPAMHILDALYDPDPGVTWHMQGLGGAPVTDIVLRLGGKARAVVEVKTPTVLTDKEINTIFTNLHKYRLTKKLPQNSINEPSVLSLTRLGTIYETRVQRDKDVYMVEQVIAQMYDMDVNYGALTNFYMWLISERDGNHFKVTKVEGVVDEKNKGLEIVLALSMKALADDNL